MQDHEHAFIGTGWHFPPAFGKGGGSLDLASGWEDVEQSLEILLTTAPGERVMQDDFGCALNGFLFEPVTSGVLYEIQDLIATAILYHEPRVAVDEVLVYEEATRPGLLLIDISYTLIATNSRYNMVYPFYIQEATGLSL